MTEEEKAQAVEDFHKYHTALVVRLAGVPPHERYERLDRWITEQLIYGDESKRDEWIDALAEAAGIFKEALERNITTPEEFNAFLKEKGKRAVDLVATLTNAYIAVLEGDPEAIARFLGISLEEVQEIIDAARKAVKEGRGASIGIYTKLRELEERRAA
uniref:dad_t1 n=1 Tax=synthetic construct TaxID=32630 RepID=UPI0039FDE1A9